ncbi:MAG: winged helix-turn-helix transcriptional regulator [Bacilli bacterium]|nr:winged helix-turn-helix transcriptional regulator [Bacilli bacterium]
MTRIDKDLFLELGQFYKIMGDETRLRILNLLEKSELKVGEIAEQLEMTHSAISHQLQVLRFHEFVKAKRKGKEIYYSLKDEHVMIIVKYGMEHILERKKI